MASTLMACVACNEAASATNSLKPTILGLGCAPLPMCALPHQHDLRSIVPESVAERVSKCGQFLAGLDQQRLADFIIEAKSGDRLTADEQRRYVIRCLLAGREHVGDFEHV